MMNRTNAIADAHPWEHQSVKPEKASQQSEHKPSNSSLANVARMAFSGRDDAQPTKTALSVQNFSSWYGGFQALHGIDLEVPLHRVTALIGPSGCGKSTFLRWVNRMNDLIPGARSEGKMSLLGADLTGKQVDAVDLRRRVGMVFQKPNPFPKSIYDNVAFGPRLHYKLNKSETDDLVESSLRASALWDEVKDRLKQSALGLSGGQQQRLCIARAIALSPDVLLMDEPCSALDPKATIRIEDLIVELRKEFTILIVTHNMQQAARVSDQTAFFYEGKLIEFDDTINIFTNPKSTQTEDYVTGRFG